MNRRKLAYWISAVFCIVLALQLSTWIVANPIDRELWGSEAYHVLHWDGQQFDFYGGYGHPGGPVIEGTILVHELTRFSYTTSAEVAVALILSLLITAVCIVSYIIRRNLLWSVAAAIILSFNWLYMYATPPSGVAAVLFALLGLVFFYLYENTPSKSWLIFSGILVGLMFATRIEIGFLSVLFFGVLLSRKLGVRGLALVLMSLAVSFVVFDPFMWIMPTQHLVDLVHKMTLHYSDIGAVYVSWMVLVQIWAVAVIGVLLGIGLLLFKHTRPLINKNYLYVALGMTVLFCVIFLTSHSQAPRYYLPILFFWQIWLPYFFFTSLERAQESSPQVLGVRGLFYKIVFLMLVFFYNAINLAHYYL